MSTIDLDKKYSRASFLQNEVSIKGVPHNFIIFDIILLFLVKLPDKHGITLVHITYPPSLMICKSKMRSSMFKVCQIQLIYGHRVDQE